VTGARVQNCPGTLTQQQLTNFNSLSATLTQILGSETPCPGDGNLDKVVDQQDIKNWALFSQIGCVPGSGVEVVECELGSSARVASYRQASAGAAGSLIGGFSLIIANDSRLM
jgi:hypothetical protein